MRAGVQTGRLDGRSVAVAVGECGGTTGAFSDAAYFPCAAKMPMMDPADQMRTLRTGCGVLAPPRGFVTVEGPDAEALLQNLLTQDLADMAEGEARRALLLTPKARIVADVRVLRTSTGFLLETADAEALAALLLRYRLASKAEIAATGHWSLISLIGPDAPGIELPGLRLETTLGALPRVDVVVPTIGLMGSLSAAERAGAVPVEASAVEALRVEAGELDADERWMPAEAGLVDLAVSFEKGCFIGQEPVTRLHRRGHANRTPRRLSADGPLAPGAAITQDGKEVGVVLAAAGPPWLDAHRAIGIVRVDAATPLTVLDPDPERAEICVFSEQ